MIERIYIETTLVSYLTARASRDLIIAAHQQTPTIGGIIVAGITSFVFRSWSSRKLERAILKRLQNASKFWRP